MKNLALLAILLVPACASLQGGPAEAQSRADYPGYTVDEVRRAAVETVNEIARFINPARVTEDGRVVSEYAASGWTSFEISFVELEGTVEAEVRIDSRPLPSCSTGRLPRPVTESLLHARGPGENAARGYRPGTTVTAPGLDYHRQCTIRTPGGSGKREGEILDEIRLRLASGR
ncbi:MAG TPA: hypothetical protein VMR66_06435 [Gemmatimonadota bacterium]|nr:hypothetical protein [Gemmatimonadota bacterium]